MNKHKTYKDNFEFYPTDSFDNYMMERKNLIAINNLPDTNILMQLTLNFTYKGINQIKPKT